MQNTLVIIMAGGTGDRLQPLTLGRSKPAVPFGGKFRLIDFTLSNCINSGIRKISVLTQYKSASLQKHIQEGWGISSSGLGEYIYCVPAQQKTGKDWYGGTADAVRQNLDLIGGRDVEHILILSGDHIYKMNYRQILGFHKARNADLTMSAVRVKNEEAANKFGVIAVNNDFKLIEFIEKPAIPHTIPGDSDYCLASMGIYVFKTGVLVKALQRGGGDFGKDILPSMMNDSSAVSVYDFTTQNKIEDYVDEVEGGVRRRVLVQRTRDSSYWRDVGSLDSYYDTSMELVGVDPIFNLYGEKWVFRTYQRPLPPSKYIIGGRTLESLVSDGCVISGGLVQRSILSPAVIVEKDSVVEDSIIFDDAIIEPGCRIKHAIIDKEVTIHAGASIGYDLDADRRKGCTISENGVVVVPRGMNIEAT